MSAAKPQVNIMAPHVKKEYLGFSPFSPNTTSPYFEQAKYIDVPKINKPITK